jgi:hypothetical protein
MWTALRGFSAHEEAKEPQLLRVVQDLKDMGLKN